MKSSTLFTEEIANSLINEPRDLIARAALFKKINALGERGLLELSESETDNWINELDVSLYCEYVRVSLEGRICPLCNHNSEENVVTGSMVCVECGFKEGDVIPKPNTLLDWQLEKLTSLAGEICRYWNGDISEDDADRDVAAQPIWEFINSSYLGAALKMMPDTANWMEWPEDWQLTIAGALEIVGTAFEEGTNVIPKNIEKAVYWYGIGVAVNCDQSMVSLGKLFETGVGVEQDPVKALELYRRAAEFDCSPANAELVRCYLNGIGCDINPLQAWQEIITYGELSGCEDDYIAEQNKILVMLEQSGAIKLSWSVGCAGNGESLWEKPINVTLSSLVDMGIEPLSAVLDELDLNIEKATKLAILAGESFHSECVYFLLLQSFEGEELLF